MNDSTIIKNKNDVFVVTKPLQYINALNIKSNNNKVLIIVGLFTKSDLLFNKIKINSKHWNSFIYFENMNDTFNWLIENKSKIQNLFIDSDINNRKQFYLLRKNNISVYEEGVGTYLKQLYKPRRFFLGNLYLHWLNLRGYKNRRGGNKYTKRIIVYFPEFYSDYLREQKKIVEGFEKPFIEHISTSKELQIFDPDINFSEYYGKIVLIYVSDWLISQEDFDLVKQINCDQKILKPHPHLKSQYTSADFDLTVDPIIPCELIILRLLQVSKKIILVSRFSTSSVYFTFHPKIELINLDIKPEPYVDNDSYLDAYFNLVKYIKNKIYIEEI